MIKSKVFILRSITLLYIYTLVQCVVMPGHAVIPFKIDTNSLNCLKRHLLSVLNIKKLNE